LSVIGITLFQEEKLTTCYANISLVIDFGTWREWEGMTSSTVIATVIKTLILKFSQRETKYFLRQFTEEAVYDLP
jgi:hypothetical protein